MPCWDCFNKNTLRNLAFGFGLIFVTLAILLNLFWNEISNEIIKNQLKLSVSTKSHSLWVQNPFPFHVDFYFFNWTNPTDLKQSGYKPNFTEVGPYRFREEVKKVNVKWNGNNTVTYKKLRRWYFEEKESNGSLNDTITTLNIIALTAARTTKYWNRIARIPLSVTLSSTQQIYVSKQVRELLFEGFADPLIEFGSKIPGISTQVPFDRFGWFYKRNDSSEFDGVFNVETGANGLETIGKLKFWNYQNRTNFYKNLCGAVIGSAGDFWPPQKFKLDKITLFSPDLCRYINFIYKTEQTVEGVKGFRFDSGPDLFDNGTTSSENRCFCNGRCPPSGTVNVSSCRFSSPAFISYPHFYLGDASYLTSINGMKPDFKKHEMYIVLEQKWGIPLEVAVRLQINVLVESDPGIRMFDGVPTIFFPMIWFQQKVTMPQKMGEELKLLLRLPKLGLVTSIVFYLIGFSCLVFHVMLENYVRRKKNKKELTFCCCNVKSWAIKRRS